MEGIASDTQLLVDLASHPGWDVMWGRAEKVIGKRKDAFVAQCLNGDPLDQRKADTLAGFISGVEYAKREVKRANDAFNREEVGVE